MSVKMRRICLEGLGQRLCGCPAHFRARIVQQIERRLDGERLGPDLKTKACNGLVEQPIPGRISGHRLFVKELLDAVIELIRLLLADVFQPGTVMRERRIAFHRSIEHGVIDAI